MPPSHSLTGDLRRTASSRARALAWLGLAGMLIGAVDPLEGSVVILAGTGLAVLAAVATQSPHRKPLWRAFFLVAAGVAALFVLSALGGIGGPGGLSNWWGLLLVPYPVGWILGLVAVFHMLREGRAPDATP